MNSVLLGIIAGSGVYADSGGAGEPSVEWSAYAEVSSGASSRTVSIPSDVEVGHFMVGLCFSRGAVSASGWTKEFETDQSNLGGRVTVFTKTSTAAGAGQSFTAAYDSGSGRIDVNVVGFSYTGAVAPYIAPSVVTGSVSSGTSIELDYGLVGTYGIPFFCMGVEYRLTSGSTGYTASVDVNGSPYNMSFWEFDNFGGTDVNGSRLASRCATSAFLPSDNIQNLFQQSVVSPQSVCAGIFIVTCGKT